MDAMRRIESYEEKEKREKKRAKVIGIVLLLVMVLSTVGYAFLYNPMQDSTASTGTIDTSVEEGKVQNIGSQWVLQSGGEQFIFSNSPENVKNISVEIQRDINSYYGNTLYIDSSSKEVYEEIGFNLGKYSSRVQESCYGKCDDPELPEKNCTSNIIVFRDNENRRVYQNESCIFIEGDIKSADAFLYKILKVS